MNGWFIILFFLLGVLCLLIITFLNTLYGYLKEKNKKHIIVKKQEYNRQLFMDMVAVETLIELKKRPTPMVINKTDNHFKQETMDNRQTNTQVNNEYKIVNLKK